MNLTHNNKSEIAYPKEMLVKYPDLGYFVPGQLHKEPHAVHHLSPHLPVHSGIVHQGAELQADHKVADIYSISVVTICTGTSILLN